MGAGIIRDGVDRSSLLHALRILPLLSLFCCSATYNTSGNSAQLSLIRNSSCAREVQ